MTKKKHNDYWHKRSNDIMRYVDGTDIDMFANLTLYNALEVSTYQIINRTLRSIVSRPKITQIC